MELYLILNCYAGVLSGATLISLHYNTVMRLWKRVPVTIAVGPSNTGKSLLARVAASLVGIHHSGMYKKMSDAKAEEIMHRSIFFVLNDPSAFMPTSLVQRINDGKS